ncbi:MAG: aminotransferase class IV [Cytophagales bacterium]|nr:aminotransferase class IV [Cytophagales bacterium]
MKVIHNSRLKDFRDLALIRNNRGFKYGDGLFETISYVYGRPRLLHKHLERLRNGMSTLRLSEIPGLSKKSIDSQLQKLRIENKIESRGKSRIYVWREGPGLYCPNDCKTSTLVTLENDNGKDVSFSENAGFSKTVINFPSATSQFKTISALKYVIAGIEKSDRLLDEIIIKDSKGFVSETLSSNIFIRIEGRYLTPPLSTGCINGIMRSWLVESMKRHNFSISEKNFTESDLLKADSVFTSNSMGISHIGKIGKTLFTIDEQVNFLMKELMSVNP